MAPCKEFMIYREEPEVARAFNVVSGMPITGL